MASLGRLEVGAHLRWLLGDEGQPQRLASEWLFRHYLGGFAYLALNSEAERAFFSGAYQQSFSRRAALLTAMHQASWALSEARVEHLFLGSLTYSDRIYPHPGARFSQDIDLLVRSPKEKITRLSLSKLGWAPLAGYGPLTRDGLLLDLHTSPGDEARFPVLRVAWRQSTEWLFAQSRAAEEVSPFCHQLSPEAELINRVIHAYKHYLAEPHHLLDLVLLLRADAWNHEVLSVLIKDSRSGRMFAALEALFAAWRLHHRPLPISKADREFAQRKVVRRAIHRAASGVEASSDMRMIAALLPWIWRFLLFKQVAWPDRTQISRIGGLQVASDTEAISIRMQRLGKVLSSIFRSS